MLSRPLSAPIEEHVFGSRRASAAKVKLRSEGDEEACWIESLDNGWFFLIPAGAASTWLLAVGGPVEWLLERSRLIAPRIELQTRTSPEFLAAPRIASPLFGADWIACGAAAVGFDPICGDGTANAVREGTLASAVVSGITDGGDAESLLHHFDARITTGMLRHISLCETFYRRGGNSDWWRGELDSLERGRGWCIEKLKTVGEPRYQLRGLVLELR